MSGVFILIGSVINLGFFTSDTVQEPSLFPTISAIIYLFLIRLPLRSILKDKRCDLMVQT